MHKVYIVDLPQIHFSFERAKEKLGKRKPPAGDKLPEIQSIGINREPALIAVGALHLPGESGLINLLRMTGFTVTPVVMR